MHLVYFSEKEKKNSDYNKILIGAPNMLKNSITSIL
jgi:hypothetical protein